FGKQRPVGVVIKSIKSLRDGTPFIIDDAFISLVVGHGIKGGVIIGLSVTVYYREGGVWRSFWRDILRFQATELSAIHTHT
ncbi:hypothetical protein, partial [Aeromonas hydrophila]|uniref:hypothetical protein n=1 Tax=Aeromonas hydrophila TaxID=644 RepID=UPI001C4071B0